MSLTDSDHWLRLWRSVGARGDGTAWHERLVNAYSEAGRYYHNLRHIEECLLELERVRGDAMRPELLEAAFWFHDAVYDPRSVSNEEESARLVENCLCAAGLRQAEIDTVRHLILATKTHETGLESDAALMIDIDLAILGRESTRFWEYEAAIRAEYAWVPAAEFAAKRVAILRRFLAREAVYQTDAFRSKYEAAARLNLTAAIVRLERDVQHSTD